MTVDGNEKDAAIRRIIGREEKAGEGERSELPIGIDVWQLPGDLAVAA